MPVPRVVVAMALALSTVGPLPAQVVPHDHTSPYAAFRDREIKALSVEDVQGLLAGSGLAMALSGELNGYPGPRHVLDMAPMLGLSPNQQAAIRAIFQDMQERAISLGEDIVRLERELDKEFADATITDQALRRLVGAIATATGELRVVHLSAHLRLRPLLTDSQVKQYEKGRGYGS